MLQENPYKMRADLLSHKYKGVIEKFANCCDDRAIAVNLFGMLTEACKEMEGIKNNSICVAFNNYFNDQEATMERITTRFTGEVYADHHWTPFDRPVYRVYRLDCMGNFKQERCTLDEDAAVQQVQSDREIGFTSSVIEERPDGSRWSLEIEGGAVVGKEAAA